MKRFCLAAGLAVCLFGSPAIVASAKAVTPSPLVYHVVTNEIATKQADGTKMEVYRFDPGVYIVHQGDTVVLSILGVKGHDHPVSIPGYHVQGLIRKSQETNLRFVADKVGMFPVVCTSHMDVAHNGPMEGYLIVLPRT